jgi:hypothetical protein
MGSVAVSREFCETVETIAVDCGPCEPRYTGQQGIQNQAVSRFGMKRLKNPVSQYAVCVENRNYPASLELRKIYRVAPDASAAAHGQIRVIDESGEDYLFPKEYFVTLELPESVEEVLFLSSTR